MQTELTIKLLTILTGIIITGIGLLIGGMAGLVVGGALALMLSSTIHERLGRMTTEGRRRYRRQRRHEGHF